MSRGNATDTQNPATPPIPPCLPPPLPPSSPPSPSADNSFTIPTASQQPTSTTPSPTPGAAHFYHWVPALSQKYNVIRRELRGHGASSHPKPEDEYDYSVETIISEIIDTLDQLGLAKVHFLGESTSGMLAEILAAKHPDRVSSIIICSSPHPPPRSGTEIPRFWGEVLAGGDQSQRDAVVGRVSGCRAMMTVESMRELAEKIPSARLRLIESGGHEIYSTAAEECQGAVLEFLEGLEVE
ncbi:Alpha/Beta hydrolase protein [Penicillium maclennaniae]|uniref:Alpha/Beta hydrolase protein n=1 Tax=Penicillium maclennaniae TaxID=1343394 RepID=UPI00253FEC4A|nr:Alpha/Beta hydrolase protein [Penicillium maclennaniae]KAJ5677041.1 Alpha/Beta hydrolase protein [Penicillium maclennaniae]